MTRRACLGLGLLLAAVLCGCEASSHGAGLLRDMGAVDFEDGFSTLSYDSDDVDDFEDLDDWDDWDDLDDEEGPEDEEGDSFLDEPLPWSNKGFSDAGFATYQTALAAGILRNHPRETHGLVMDSTLTCKSLENDLHFYRPKACLDLNDCECLNDGDCDMYLAIQGEHWDEKTKVGRLVKCLESMDVPENTHWVLMAVDKEEKDTATAGAAAAALKLKRAVAVVFNGHLKEVYVGCSDKVLNHVSAEAAGTAVRNELTCAWAGESGKGVGALMENLEHGQTCEGRKGSMLVCVVAEKSLLDIAKDDMIAEVMGGVCFFLILLAATLMWRRLPPELQLCRLCIKDKDIHEEHAAMRRENTQSSKAIEDIMRNHSKLKDNRGKSAPPRDNRPIKTRDNRSPTKGEEKQVDERTEEYRRKHPEDNRNRGEAERAAESERRIQQEAADRAREEEAKQRKSIFGRKKNTNKT